MFDVDGNVLLSNSIKSSFNNSNIGASYTQSIIGCPMPGNGPQAHISPMNNFRKLDDNSIKPTGGNSLSQGPPTCRGVKQ